MTLAHRQEFTPAQPREPGVDVRGGVAGIAFQWEELAAGTASLHRLATEVETVVQELARQVRVLELGTFSALAECALIAGGNGTSAECFSRRGLDAVEAARESRVALGVVHADLAATAQMLAASRAAYLVAEAFASSAVARAAAVQEAAAWWAGVVTESAGLTDLRPIVVERRAATGSITSLEGNLEGLLGTLESVEGDPDGSLEILAAENADGAVYVVVLPGTQGESFNSSNPFDLGGNIEAMQFGSTYVAEAVGTALEQSGARPGDQVMIAGYSQGGLHAMNVAADEQIRARYDIELVLTVGSPTGAMVSGPDTDYVHLEHIDDVVPNFVTTDNPDERHRVTVTLRNEVPEFIGEGKGLGPAHKLANYQQGAAAIEADDMASLAPAASALAALGSAAVVRRHHFTLRRKPPDAPVAKTNLPLAPQR